MGGEVVIPAARLATGANRLLEEAVPLIGRRGGSWILDGLQLSRRAPQWVRYPLFTSILVGRGSVQGRAMLNPSTPVSRRG